jgi:hypothetical protein
MTLRLSVRRKSPKRSIRSLQDVNGTTSNPSRSDPADSSAEMSAIPHCASQNFLKSARLHADEKLTVFWKSKRLAD